MAPGLREPFEAPRRRPSLPGLKGCSPLLKDLRALDPNRLHLLPLGTGNAFTRTRFHSSFLLICGGRVVLVDAPAPLRRMMFEAQRASGFAIDSDSIDALFLTHLHGDHCNGVEELGFHRHFIVGGPRPEIHLHESLCDPLWRRLSPVMALDGDGGEGLGRYFAPRPFGDGEVIDLGIAGLRCRPIAMEHFLPCYGFRIDYGGFSLGFSADTRFHPPFIEAVADCDLIIHECGPGDGHTSGGELLALEESLRGRMVLTHLADDFEAAEFPIPSLREGSLYRVGDGREPMAAG